MIHYTYYNSCMTDIIIEVIPAIIFRIVTLSTCYSQRRRKTYNSIRYFTCRCRSYRPFFFFFFFFPFFFFFHRNPSMCMSSAPLRYYLSVKKLWCSRKPPLCPQKPDEVGLIQVKKKGIALWENIFGRTTPQLMEPARYWNIDHKRGSSSVKQKRVRARKRIFKREVAS